MSFMSQTRSKRTRAHNKSLSTWEQHLTKHGGDVKLARSTPFTPPDYDKLEKERIKLYQMERVSSYTGKGKPLADWVANIKKPVCKACTGHPHMTLTKYGEFPETMFTNPASPLYLKDQIPLLQFTCPNCQTHEYREYIEQLKRFVYNPNNAPKPKSTLTWSHLFSPSSSNVSPHTIDKICPKCRASKELLCECHFVESKVTTVPIELRSVPDFPKPVVKQAKVIETPRTEEYSHEHGKRLVNTRYANCLPLKRNYNRKLSRREWLKTKEYTQGYQFRPADWFEGK